MSLDSRSLRWAGAGGLLAGYAADRVIVKGSLSLAEIGRQLRTLYAQSAAEPVPSGLQGLIDRLAERER